MSFRARARMTARMIRDLIKAVQQLPDPPVRKRIGVCVAMAGGVMASLWLISWFLLSLINFEAIPWMPQWGADLLTGAGVLGVVILTFLFFSSILAAIAGFFLEGVCAAVEAKHYPGLPPAREQPFGEMIVMAAKFIGLAIGLNLLALPIYLIFPPIFLIVNGYLVGREFFEIAAFRRVDTAESHRLRRAHRGQLLAMGAALAFLLTLPLINLVAPVIAAAAMTHRFHALRAG